MRFLTFSIIFFTGSFLIACGGGGSSDNNNSNNGNSGLVYGGSKTAADITAGNAGTLAIAAAGGVTQAIAADAADGVGPGKGPILFNDKSQNNSFMVRLSENVVQILSYGNSAEDELLVGVCTSGTADLTVNNDGSQGTITYKDCVVDGGYGETLNGIAKYTTTLSGGTLTAITISFIDFKVTYQGETQTINMTTECSGEPFTCTIYSDYIGLDGRTYRVELDLVTSYPSNTFDVLATVYDPEHGTVTINASAIGYSNCAGGVPSTGTITITEENSTDTASIVFNSCDSFTVTYGGLSEEYFWANILIP